MAPPGDAGASSAVRAALTTLQAKLAPTKEAPLGTAPAGTENTADAAPAASTAATARRGPRTSDAAAAPATDPVAIMAATPAVPLNPAAVSAPQGAARVDVDVTAAAWSSADVAMAVHAAIAALQAMLLPPTGGRGPAAFSTPPGAAQADAVHAANADASAATVTDAARFVEEQRQAADADAVRLAEVSAGRPPLLTLVTGRRSSAGSGRCRRKGRQPRGSAATGRRR